MGGEGIDWRFFRWGYEIPICGDSALLRHMISLRVGIVPDSASIFSDFKAIKPKLGLRFLIRFAIILIFESKFRPESLFKAELQLFKKLKREQK